MAYYTNLIAAWNNATQPPPGVTGTALTALSTANKIAAINAWTITGTPQKAVLSPSAVINAIVASDLASLTTAQVSLLTLLLQGSSIDASVGTTIRAAAQAIFAGKTATLTALGALVAPFDAPQIPWWSAPTGGALTSPVGLPDLAAAGNLT